MPQPTNEFYGGGEVKTVPEDNSGLKDVGVRKFTILYGSQTGTAQEIAERIWRESKRYYFTCPIHAMDEYPIDKLIYEHFVVFVCSTTGNGVEPDNMKRFWKFLLRKSLPLDSLAGLRFAVLGLGDSSYQKFNFAAKKLNRRLLQLGAHALVDAGYADDQHDLGSDAVVDPWIEKLWMKLLEEYPLPVGVDPLGKDSLCPPRWDVSLSTVSHEPRDDYLGATEMEIDKIKKQFTQDNPCLVELESNTRTTSTDHFQDVRLLQFSAPEIEYEPGDVLMVQPCNSQVVVDQFFATVSNSKNHKLDPNAIVRVKACDMYSPVPKVLQKPLTLRECVETYWDLNMVPHRYFFELLSHFTTNDLERERLKEFVSPEGQQDLYNYSNRPRRTILEVLSDFPHAAANIPLPYLFEIFRPIQPRAFSIASSPRAHVGKLHILVAVVQYKTRLVTPRLGLCSNWLKSLIPGQKIPVWVRKGTFMFPKNTVTPVIMIGPGTGVAPFRSYIFDRVAQDQAGASALYLFFGCRSQNADFHCKKEWLGLQKENLMTLFCAFSRDQEEKVYVQHVLKQQASLVWDLVHEKNASIFIAGRAEKMPDDVREVLLNDVGCLEGCLSEEEAANHIQLLETSGRLQMETWS
ncbi:NADPH-dependent diflavin oxidoreductase 1 isoform X2 [Anabrus simplex]|uniref:NADPH-dependent diflavin oxidoreductase 1 isoform X2 n=1 Tax=Anabrus simplex TaxID=316456 RepID=UPI0035A26986